MALAVSGIALLKTEDVYALSRSVDEDSGTPLMRPAMPFTPPTRISVVDDGDSGSPTLEHWAPTCAVPHPQQPEAEAGHRLDQGAR